MKGQNPNLWRDGERRCARCHQYKPADVFRTCYRKGVAYTYSYCDDCHRERSRRDMRLRADQRRAAAAKESQPAEAAKVLRVACGPAEPTGLPPYATPDERRAWIN